jgi:hypothetical protein
MRGEKVLGKPRSLFFRCVEGVRGEIYVPLRSAGALARTTAMSRLSFASAARAPNTASKSYQRTRLQTHRRHKEQKKRTFPSRLVNSPTKPLATQLPTPSGFFSFSHPRFPLTSLIRSDCGVQFVMAVLCDSVRTDDPMSWAMDVMVLLFCTGDEGERRGRYESRYSTFNQKGDCHWCCGPAVPLIAHLK